MSIDILSFDVALSIISFFFVIALYVQYRIDKTHHGLGWWMFGIAFIALGSAFYSLRVIPALANVSIIGNNILFITGIFLLCTGVHRFFDRREPRNWLIVLGAFYVLSIIYFTLIDDNFIIRRSIFSFSTAIISFLTAQVLLIYKTRQVTSSSRFLAFIFIMNGIFLCVRTISPLFSSAAENAFSPSVMQISTFLVSFATISLMTFGFIVMVNQQLNSESREARENLEIIFNTSPNAVLITRFSDGFFVDANDQFTGLTGFTRADVRGKTIPDINLWQDPADRQKLLVLLEEKGSCENLEFPLRRKDGSQMIASMSAMVTNLQGIPHIISVTQDVTEQKRMEAALRESEEKYRFMTENSGDVIWHMNRDLVFDYMSPADENMRGFKREEVIGTTVWSLLSPEGIELVRNLNEQRLIDEQKGIRTGAIKFEAEQISKDGSWIWTEVHASPHHDQNGRLIGYHGVTRDIHERKQLQMQLQQRATIDDLTGVFNRGHFLDIAQIEVKRAIRNRHPLVIVLSDIDHFKQINDTYGHATGDRVLVLFSKICQKNIRDIDIFARFGGDEFVLLLSETDLENAFKVVERIRQALVKESADINGGSISITVSSGLACVKSQVDTLDSLLGRADNALYRAKAAGRNRVVMADEADSQAF